MRSYHDHLQSLTKPANRPIFRASAIFPVIQNEGLTSRILFMGYWILKRHIEKLSWITTLRSQKGEIIKREISEITEPKSFRIELAELLETRELSFEGSIECEFFSNTPLVFPFPALVLNLYGPNFSTTVHTAQRVYNDGEDREINSKTSVPESGFNIYTDKEKEPFITLINGPEKMEKGKIECTCMNVNGEKLGFSHTYQELKPYELLILYPARKCNLEGFLKGKVGTAKVKFAIDWIYPRLIVGNVMKDQQGAVITHTYYDCSEAKEESDYWMECEKGWHGATLMIPLKREFSRIYFYPIYSPSKFTVDVEIYDPIGNCVYKKENVLTLSAPTREFEYINIHEFLNLDEKYTARIIANPIEKNLPARIKIGLDLGKEGKLPSNICTNLIPFMPAIENKPFTFKWCPVLDQVWIVNSSPAKEYQREAEITLTMHRESDQKTIVKMVTLPPHGSYQFAYEEYQDFFEGQPGWVSVISTNPYILTYYFISSFSGITGGDHGF